MKVRKGCWTCAARKIQCDRVRPTCEKCARSQRHCQGYEVRLSWPRHDDERRAMTGDNALPMMASPDQSRHRATDLFINTTWHEMELHGYLSGQTHTYHPFRSLPKLWTQPQQRVDHMDLVHYSHGAVSGLALFYALLAYSSLHRYGLNEQALEYKIQALQSLSASVTDQPLITAEGAQHVAASMLLGAFETLQPSEGSGEWLWHIWGAMDTIQATQLKYQPHESDIGRLLDWVHYHETISRFTVQHWRNKPLISWAPIRNHPGPRDLQSSSLSRHRPNVPSVNPTHAIMNLLSEISDTLIDPRDPKSRNEEYQDRLKDLEKRIGSISIRPTPPAPNTDAMFAVELYQMATRIYLVRASQSPWEPTVDLDALIEETFDGPVKSCTCEHFFPLFILACEAYRDEQRIAIINLVERTQRDARIRSIEEVKNTIQSIWVQQDLHKDDDVLVDYLGIMSAVISSSSTIPSFA
ncbi:Zinc-finger transcription factor [Diaporthe amygdali]|uniref:Zinc-finger transcription factor n=1 Tax=Phomopsis amygdali TaxID=1214568 RepID=UPI0022FE4E17|nr:Zinc-finger transcription factor [Diaporthe amygdali]KAJ0120840.1 Zinc-finger transcription factor [Diaporthe amygdali]